MAILDVDGADFDFGSAGIIGAHPRIGPVGVHVGVFEVPGPTEVDGGAVDLELEVSVGVSSGLYGVEVVVLVAVPGVHDGIEVDVTGHGLISGEGPGDFIASVREFQITSWSTGLILALGAAI